MQFAQTFAECHKGLLGADPKERRRGGCELAVDEPVLVARLALSVIEIPDIASKHSLKSLNPWD